MTSKLFSELGLSPELLNAINRLGYKLQSIERYTKMRIARHQIPSVDEVEEKRGNLFFEKIRVALQKGDFEKESRVVDRLLEQGFSSTDIACAVIHELRKDDTRNLKSKVTRPIKESHHGQLRNKKHRNAGFREKSRSR